MKQSIIDLDHYLEKYKEMEAKLLEMGTPWNEGAEYFQQIDLVRQNLRELQPAFVPPFGSQDNETMYHRGIWPPFYGKLFFYLLAQRFCFQRHVQPFRPIRELIEKEQQRINRYFLQHRNFWVDHLYGVDVFSEQFTQSYSRCLLEPLSMILDAAGGTMAGYRVAWGLAYEEYRRWLRTIEENDSGPLNGVYEWRETKSAAAELIKSQVEAQSVYINGKPATAAQLRADFERRYGVDLKDMDNLLYAMDTLKSEDTPYLTKLKQRFTGWKKRLGK